MLRHNRRLLEAHALPSSAVAMSGPLATSFSLEGGAACRLLSAAMSVPIFALLPRVLLMHRLAQ